MADIFNNPNGTVFADNAYNPFATSGALTHSYLQDSPTASFGAFLDPNNSQGFNGASPLGQYLQRNYNRLTAQYQGDVVNSPSESFYDFLGKNRQSLQQEYNGLSPDQRNERPDSLVGRLRYVGF